MKSMTGNNCCLCSGEGIASTEMLNDGILLLCLINFGFIALLPRKFFRKGAKLSLQWWATALPLFACPAVLAISYYNVIPSFIPLDSPWLHVLGMAAVMISSVSIVLLGFAIGTHRIPIYMFHDKQDSDHGQKHLVTYGPYRYIRHPIYCSYLLALIASFVFSPNIGTLICLVYGFTALNNTAAKEEQELAHPDHFGQEYTEYMAKSNRFFPTLRQMFLITGDETMPSQTAPQQAQRAEASPQTSRK